MKSLTLAADSAKKLIWIVTLIYISATPTESQRRQLHYEPEEVALTGRVVTRTFHGPPNYGENPKTDSKESQYILLLDSPIDVIATGNDPTDETEHGVKRVTLVVFDFKKNPVKPLLGRRVRVEGTLFHTITGHHHTKVLITVSSIKRAR